MNWLENETQHNRQKPLDNIQSNKDNKIIIKQF